MPQIATFLDTSRQNIGPGAQALVADGWQKVPNTKANRKNLLLKYYEYLVNTNAKLAGINPASLTPAQLAPVWEMANRDFNKYDMYVKNVIQVSAAMTINENEAPPVIEEAFASVNDVERMQPGYVDIDDLLAGFGRMGLGGGKRRRHTRKHHTKKRKHTRKHHKSSRKTRRH